MKERSIYALAKRNIEPVECVMAKEVFEGKKEVRSFFREIDCTGPVAEFRAIAGC